MKKNRIFSRFLAFLLCATMIITYMPMSVYTFAEDTGDEAAVVQEEPSAAPAETTTEGGV